MSENILKQITMTLDKDKIFKKMTIICEVDNYKFNQKGNLLIDTKEPIITLDNFDEEINLDNSKQIPFKSYIWLFKCIDDNNLELNYIPNYLYKINPIIFSRANIELTDSDIIKNIYPVKINIYLNSSFYNISSLTINEPNYMHFANIYFFELNEKILFMLKKIISRKPQLYINVFEKIFGLRYTFTETKIMILINLNKEYPDIKLINGYPNFNSILTKYRTNKERKNFLKANS